MTLSSFAQVDDQTKYKMYCSALDNNSTAPNYVVVTVKNLKTGEKKEICTEAPFLIGAVDRQTGNSTKHPDCKENKNRYFEFSRDSALWNISFDLYTRTDLEKFAKTFDVAKIVQQVKNAEKLNLTFESNKEQVMFAHLMFNNGVMMSRGCVAGNICELTYFKSK